MSTPKLFISYSWSSPDHEVYVLKLATELRGAGIDVILDKWDLKPGQCANKFMEQMVGDPAITKVILVCDKAYAEKANERKGGVGTETQIISPEIYASQDQTKFVALITERDAEGKPYVPTYARSRIHIDMSEPSNYTEKFEELVRWALDKPLHIKPALGKIPNWLDEKRHVQLTTSAYYRRAIDAIQAGRPNAVILAAEYFDHFATEIEKFKITDICQAADDVFMDNIESFIPYRDELLRTIDLLSRHIDTPDMYNVVHRFFEKLIPYCYLPTNFIGGYNDTDFDNFKFFTHELFLYTIAIFISHERFTATGYLLQKEYYSERNVVRNTSPMVPYSEFRHYVKMFQVRNERLDLGRQNLHADILKQRNATAQINFFKLMQADFILYLRDQLTNNDLYGNWFPVTLVYLGHFYSSFEVFARSSSRAYFDKMKDILGIQDIGTLAKYLEAVNTGKIKIPGQGFHSFSPKALLGFDELCMKP